MIFHQTDLGGVFIIEPELIKDERGFFACAWIASEFESMI
jgi:dTDP-4-dehydrorhamnose 3,5-epimerase-like enzyme